ncbi:hypothetical protein HDU76_012287, partial [Blyttiomyces sp. JEL0837]
VANEGYPTPSRQQQSRSSSVSRGPSAEVASATRSVDNRNRKANQIQHKQNDKYLTWMNNNLIYATESNISFLFALTVLAPGTLKMNFVEGDVESLMMTDSQMMDSDTLDSLIWMAMNLC